MPKPQKLSNDAESQLGGLGAHHKGFELYDGLDFSVQGLKDQDYRWKLTFKETGRVVMCMSLGEAVKAVRAAIDPALKRD